jgi:uncharacterized protein YqgV (UPF0045/DUF77 family)
MATSPPTTPFFGARFSLYPMSDRYVPLILEAIGDLRTSGLEVETDDVSTFLGGDRDAVFAHLEHAFAAVARTGTHVVMTVLVSHGCPGETYCEAPGEVQPPAPATSTDGRTGVDVSCQWSLYPLGVPGYMDVIYREIDRTKGAKVYRKGRHFVSQLGGDLHEVLSAVRTSFDAACHDVPHVTAHIVISANSPSPKGVMQ